MTAIQQRIEIMKTEYNTDDADNPKEIATLYNVFEVDDGVRSSTLYFMTIIRQKSRIVFKQEYARDFIQAMIQYQRTIRNRAEIDHPVAVQVRDLERVYEAAGGHIEP